MKSRPRVAFLTGSSADWGGASRVLYTTLREIDLTLLEPVVLLSGEGPIRQVLEARGIRCIVWGPLTEPENKVAYFRTMVRMMLLLRRERIAVLHVNHRFWRPAEVLAAFLMRIPVLLHFHLVNEVEGSFMSRCRAAICVSRYVAEHSVPSGLHKDVVYNPVDLSRFTRGVDKRAEWGLGSQHVVVSYLGQILEVKGVQDFIAMARRLPDSNARFLIAGECRDPKKYPGSYGVQDLHQMIGGDARIRYLGYVGQVEDVYRSSDIIVVPSRWQEPLGLINLEAGACGKPIVATRVGGIPEIVIDGRNGFLVEPGDVAALAASVQRLIEDTALRQRMGQEAYDRVVQGFTSRPVREFEALLLRYA